MVRMKYVLIFSFLIGSKNCFSRQQKDRGHVRTHDNFNDLVLFPGFVSGKDGVGDGQ